MANRLRFHLRQRLRKTHRRLHLCERRRRYRARFLRPLGDDLVDVAGLRFDLAAAFADRGEKTVEMRGHVALVLDAPELAGAAPMRDRLRVRTVHDLLEEEYRARLGMSRVGLADLLRIREHVFDL